MLCSFLIQEEVIKPHRGYMPYSNKISHIEEKMYKFELKTEFFLLRVSNTEIELFCLTPNHCTTDWCLPTSTMQITT